MTDLICSYYGCNGALISLLGAGVYPGWGRFERRKCIECEKISIIAPTYFNKRELDNLNFDLKTDKHNLRRFF